MTAKNAPLLDIFMSEWHTDICLVYHTLFETILLWITQILSISIPLISQFQTMKLPISLPVADGVKLLKNARIPTRDGLHLAADVTGHGSKRTEEAGLGARRCHFLPRHRDGRLDPADAAAGPADLDGGSGGGPSRDGTEGDSAGARQRDRGR